MATEQPRAVFQVERTVRTEPLWVAGRLLEGSLKIGDLLEREGGGAQFRIGSIDAYGRRLREVVGGVVAALQLVPEPRAAAAGVTGDPLPRGARLSLAAAP